MNTWLKIAVLAIALVVGIVVIGSFTGGDSQPKEPDPTFYDKAQEDQKKFLAEPEPLQTPQIEAVAKQQQPSPEHQVVEPVQPVPRPVELPKPKVLYFKELSEIDQMEAQRLLNAAAPARSMGRLQIGFNLMIQNCRQIIQRWPDSWYAYRAKQMMI
ncbi:MAG: hypothetical protein ACYTDV_14605, partial [Planctomycetota bacterium]